MRHKPNPSRTSYRHPPRKLFDELEEAQEDEREDPINGPGQEEQE